MRRNFAPSQRKATSTFSSPSFLTNVPKPLATALAPLPPATTTNQDRNFDSGSQNLDRAEGVHHFNVVWCKKSARKHKKWEGDAILTVRHDARLAILKDMDGTEIGRGTSLPLSSLTALESGSTISFSGKEIEIMEEVQPEAIQAFKQAATVEKIKSAAAAESTPPSVQASPCVPFKKPFAVPSMVRKMVNQNSKIVQSGMFDANNPNSVVMPRPPTGFFDESITHIVDVVLDPHVSKQLRPHQRDGIIFLYECLMGFRSPNNYGAILADEMGLGKTLQAISVIWTMLKQGPNGGRPVIKRALILAPSSLVKNWQSEFEKWLGRERIDVYAVDQSTKIGEYVKNPRHPVLIMSYEMFIRSTDLMENLDIDLLVCDEGHRLKNNQVKAAQTINQMSVDRRLVLTGTPLQNDLKEFYAIVNLVSPGSLGSSASFSKLYEDPIVRSKQPEAKPREIEMGEEKTEELNHLTSQFILRRTQEIISKYLPPKVEYVLFCPPSIAQTYIYENMVESIGSDLASLFSDTKCVLASILQLRKVCNHPSLILDDKENGDPSIRLPPELDDLTYEEKGSKLGLVSALLWSLRQQGSEKIVLVSISTQVLDLLEALCSHYNYPFLRLDGSTSQVQRQQVVSRFNNPRCDDFVLLLSSKAGGTGLNLIGASRILLFDMDWNPAHDIQAMARVWRDGQKRKVYIYRLVTAGTIEEKIFQRQLTKQGLGGGIIDPERSGGGSQQFHFSSEELKDLFTFNGDDPGCKTHELLGCGCDGDGRNIQKDEQTSLSSRSCQLTLPGSAASAGISSKSQFGQGQDLMKWQHLDPQREEVLANDPVLQSCANYLSFVFMNVTE